MILKSSKPSVDPQEVTMYSRTGSITGIVDDQAVLAPRPQGKGAALRDFYSEMRRRATSGRGAIALRGGAWSIIGYIVAQLLRTVTTLVLARHVGPEPFGVVGLVGVFLAGISMFSELGLVANIVQHPRGDEQEFLNTAFTIQAGRGFAIWGTAALAAYPVALFYKQPELFPLLVVCAMSEMIRGLTSTAAWTLNRHVKLRNITLLGLFAELAAFGVGILWALMSPSAWALVARTVASAVVYAAGSHFIAKPAVRFGWDKSDAKDILHFGGWISLSTAAYFLGGQGERLVLGKFVTPAELGCFSLAIMVSSVPAGGISQLVNQIFLPLISNTVRTNRSGTIRDVLRARRMFFGVALFTAFGFLVCAKPFVSLLLPSKYGMTGWMLQLLGLRVALDIFAAPISSLIMAYGKTKYSAAANTTRLIFMLTGAGIAFALFGVRQAIFALIIAQALSYFPLIVGLNAILPEVGRTELRWYVFFIALLVMGVVLPWPGALH
jgi:O-antigen/teichoic acid export membrane protein